MLIALTVMVAVILDHLLSEPKRFHPLVGFGYLANWLERKVNHEGSGRRLKGVLALTLLCLPALLVYAIVWFWPESSAALGCLLLYLALGGQSLRRHAVQVYRALLVGDLKQARMRVGYIVSRETQDMNETQVSQAAVESVLENGCDAIFSAIFWFVVLGPAGVVLYRISNTLDAMWGYRTPRFEQFGWAAAKLDDLLNWVPARLTALTYALMGRFTLAIHCWRTQGAVWESPNAGPVMAAGAGALAVQLGGAANYHGELKFRPTLGQGNVAQMNDIPRTLNLVLYAQWAWVLVLLVVSGVLTYV
ncbi:MAG: cobalamin biosynthesis protein [Methylococcales bacterium]|jgi:adenosylcobinamide-phosphate synthase|nr:cobalamin biosynthesis protein [Methylococcales bacterium]